MSAETIIATATTIAVRALIDGIAALREGAKAEERAEIDRMVAYLHETAPEPVASSLDGITDRHLARVQRGNLHVAGEPRMIERLAERWGPAMAGLAEGPGADRAPADLPVEGQDPDQ